MNIFSFRRVLALILALTLLGAACSGSPTDAATVNGSSISKSEVTDELKALVGAVPKVPEDLLPADQRSSLLDQLTMPDDRNAYNASAVSSVLTNKIIARLVSKALTDFGISVEDQDTQASTADIEGSLYNYAGDSVKQAAIEEGARTSRLSRYLEDPANVWYTDADVEAYYTLKKDTFDTPTACTAHILVADEALATKLVGEIKGGADFAKVAAANSTDTSNKDQGGDLGCNAEGAFVSEFEAAVKGAKDGDLVGPVKTEFGYHIIKVTSTYKVQAFDETLKKQIRSTLASPTGWLVLAASRAKVTVSSQMGTWDAKNGAVNPPQGASSGASSGSGATGK